MPIEHPPEVEAMHEALALIPPECYENPRNVGLRYVFQDLALYALGVIGLMLTDHPLLLVLLWVYTGGIIGTLFIIAHDAAHGSLFKSKKLCRWVGQGLMLPGFHVYNAWIYGHNQVHHAYTCNEEKDFVWHPTNRAEFESMTPFSRFMHRIYWSAPGTGIYYLIEIWVKKMLLFKDFPKRQAAKVAKDRAIVYTFMLVSAIVLIGAGTLLGGSVAYGFWLWFKVLIVPFLLFNYAMAITIHLHHIHPDIPWFHGDDWDYLSGALSSTVVNVPRWLNFFTHNIFVHMPHHLDSRVPFYNLPKAADALRAKYGHQYREVPLDVLDYFRNTHACKIYDFDAQRWMKYNEL